MAQDPATNDSRAETAAERLKAIRARVAELRRRITTEQDPGAVAEMRGEVGKLSALVAELIAAGGNVQKADAVMWPRDLNAVGDGPADWGTDPVEVAGG